MSIIFRDRPLKEGERSHYVCDKCGEELHPDSAYTHKCSSLKVNDHEWHGWDNPMQNKYFNRMW